SNHPAPAIRLAIRLLFFWEVRGLYAQARRWVAALLDRSGCADTITPHERAAAHFIVGNCALRQGDYEEARTRHDQAIRLWRELGDDVALAAVLAERGLAAWQLGDAAE